MVADVVLKTFTYRGREYRNGDTIEVDSANFPVLREQLLNQRMIRRAEDGEPVQSSAQREMEELERLTAPTPSS